MNAEAATAIGTFLREAGFDASVFAAATSGPAGGSGSYAILITHPREGGRRVVIERARLVETGGGDADE